LLYGKHNVLICFQIGDSLRFKISHRPDRQQLVQQHILEGKH